MDVRCERCQTEYELEDGSVSDAGSQVQCTACGHTFEVTREGTVTSEIDPSPPAAEWLLETADGQFHRFRNLTSLQKWIIERKVTREDRISRTGHAWRRLGEIVELAPFFDVVDEADRARAAALSARALKSEADAARRSSPAGGLAAVAGASRGSGQQQRLGVSGGVPLDAPDIQTSVVRVRGGRSPLRLLVIMIVAGGVAYLGITQYARLIPRAPGPVALAPAPPAPPAVVPAPTPPPAPAPAAAPTPALEAAPAKQPSAAEPVAPPPVPASPLPASASYEKLIGEADRLLENGGGVRAQKLYQQALRLKPRGAEALSGLGYTALDRGHTAQAFSFFRRSLAQQPSFAPALFGMAEAHRASGDDERALDNYRRFVSADPGGTDASAARRHIKMLESRQATRAATPAAPSGAPTQP